MQYVDGAPEMSSEAVKAKLPLKDAKVEIVPDPENPGYYQGKFMFVPHYQLEGMDDRAEHGLETSEEVGLAEGHRRLGRFINPKERSGASWLLTCSLEIPEIKGESQKKGYEEQMDIVSFSDGSCSSAPASAHGQGRRQRQGRIPGHPAS